MNSEKGIHYAWKICFVGFVIYFFVVSIVSNCIGLFVKPVSEAMGISRTAFSLSTSFLSVAGMLVSMFIGRFFKKYTIKKVMLVASFGLPVFYGCYSIAPNIYVYYVLAFMVGICMYSVTGVAISTLISNWFNEKRGLAIAIYATGSGFGGIVMNLFISYLITNYGYRMAYLILAVLLAATIIPCVAFIIKDRPEDVGLEPYGGYPRNTGKSARAAGMTTAEALKSPVFWMLLPVSAIIAVACNSIMHHTVAYFTDIGYDYTFAAKMASVVTASLALGKIVIGALFDKLGAQKTATLSLMFFLASYILYNFRATPVFMYIAVCIVGFGLSFSAVVKPYITQEFFGRKDYATIYGYMTVAASLGSVIGNPLIGSAYDTTGSYSLAWKVFMALMVLCIVLVNAAFAYTKKHTK